MADGPPKTTPVVIVGGGPVGLVSSILLSLQGIQHVLFERQPGTSIHPKAVGLNQRTVEIFRQIGVEDDVLRESAPVSSTRSTKWFTKLGPEGREIARRYAWGGGPYAEAYTQASPCRYANLAQIRLEPILLKRAQELNPDGIFYNHQVDDIQESANGVKVAFRDRKTNKGGYVSCVYALGCDGGRFVADRLSIAWNGESDLVDMVSVHFRAPLSENLELDHFLSWFVNPELGGSLKTGYLYHLGPYPVQPDTEEWVFACARLPHEQEQPFTEEDMLVRLRTTLALPDLRVDAISLSHWQVNAKVVSQYQSEGGRIFLVGDAAHRVPPWGALGLNSGIQDAQNLIWKLGMAMHQPEVDFSGLLASYDGERRPIAERVARTSLHNMRAHALILDSALGITPGNDVANNVKAMQQYLDLNDSAGQSRRNSVQQALKELDVEFYSHAAEVGWFYDTAGCDYGKSEPTRSPQASATGEMDVCEYKPCALPGHQLPHAWLTDSTNRRKSSRELVGQSKLLLIAMSPAWCEFQHDLVDVVIIDGSRNAWKDATLSWQQQAQLPVDGAVLVRPDNIVAYRFGSKNILESPDVAARVSDVVRQALRR